MRVVPTGQWELSAGAGDEAGLRYPSCSRQLNAGI